MAGVVGKTDYVILQKLGGEHIRVMKLCSKQKVLIEKLKFSAESVFGKPYGMFEVVGDQAKPLAMKDVLSLDKEQSSEKIRELGEFNTALESMSNANEEPQKLSQDDVITMKNQGISAEELVAKLVEGNKGFENRTQFSKNKYIRRKAKKHSDRVLILKPTIRMLCQSYYTKDSERLSNLRVDQLGLLIQMANVHHGSNVLVFEQSLGLVSASVIERLGGQGTCIHIHRGIIAQSIPCVHAMNFSENIYSTFCPVRITSLLSNESVSKAEEGTEEQLEEEKEIIKTESSKADRLARERRGLALMETGVDSLIVVARSVNIVSVLALALKSVKPSGCISVYSPHLHNLMEAQSWLMKKNCVNVHLSSQMYRSQQVLPDRTHPLMAQNVVGGYILSAVKVMA